MLRRTLPPRLLSLRAAIFAVVAGAAAIALTAAGGLRKPPPAVATGTEPARGARVNAGARRRPNVVVVMTDDQTAASVRFMPSVRRLIGRAGTVFSNYFVSYPLCCPSRATFLTGQYAHNS